MLKPDQPKIIFLFTPGPIGGAEKVVAGGLAALKARGLNVELWIIKEERVPQVSIDFLALLNNLNLSMRIFSTQKILDWTLWRELQIAFASSPASLIHAHGFKAAFYGRMATTKTLIITHHGKTGHTLKVKFYELLELLMMKRASAVVAVSEEMKRTLIRSGIKSSRVHVIENFMGLATPGRIATNSDSIKLIYVGRLSPEKGCESLIQALANLNNPCFKLSIVGEGVEKEKLLALVKKLKLQVQVEFLGFRHDVAQLMSRADALVMPSFREGQPLTLIEACMIGLPVLASHVGGIPELVHPGRNGLLFAPGNIHQITECLEKFYSERGSLSTNALKFKEQLKIRFAPETWAQNTSQIYQKVLSQS